MKKKIVWITPDSFVDTDMSVVPLLAKSFSIHWVIEYDNCFNCRYKESDFSKIMGIDGMSVEFVHYHRRRNPLNILEQFRFLYIVKREKPDLIYSNKSLNLFRKIIAFRLLNFNKTIQTAHQGKPHVGMSNHKKLNFIRKHTYGKIKYINMFSKSQASLMHECFPKSKIYQFTLPPKNFGTPTNSRPSNNIVRFTSFGRLVHVKRIDLLMDAACNLYERGYKNIRVIIAGACNDWDIYKSHMRYPEIFETDIRMIENSEIPNLFNSSHFFVQPYSVVSQSGPMKIGFRYNIPLITSNLPGFVDEMVEGTTGYIFESGNVRSLENTMIKAIEAVGNGEYEAMRERMKQYVETNYSESAIIGQYSEMFNEVINDSRKCQ